MGIDETFRGVLFWSSSSLEIVPIEEPGNLCEIVSKQKEMNWLLPIVMGTTAVCYINSFNKIMRIYGESGFTANWVDMAVALLPSALTSHQNFDSSPRHR